MADKDKVKGDPGKGEDWSDDPKGGKGGADAGDPKQGWSGKSAGKGGGKEESDELDDAPDPKKGLGKSADDE